MSSLSPNLRGIVLMVLATLAFGINDTLLKLATDGLPPMQVLFLRGIAAVIWCTPLVLLSGNGPKLPLLLNRFVLSRNGFELIAVIFFIVALANMPIADITALGQLAPMLLLIGMALFYGDRIGATRAGLIGVGFVGALLVAQPGGAGFSVFVPLALISALATAARDVVGRRVPKHTPALIAAYGALVVVLIGAGIGTLVFEQWVAPSLRHILLLACSGLFLTLGHILIFLAYRTGASGAVAPFYYMFTVWAVISGLVVFGTVPNGLAISGMVLILVSGITIAVLDERRRRQLLITS